MPFKSKAQRAYLAINKPSVAKKFAEHSKTKKTSGKPLPAKVAKPVTGKSRGRRSK